VTLPDAAGLFGVFLVLIAYALGVAGKMSPEHRGALLLNLIGSLLILLSLWFKPNIAAIAMEAAWALVAVFGLVRAVRR
jgi:hypothetical protein